MVKCIDCDKCNIIVDEATKDAKARCSIKTPPKQGKVITWALTVCPSYRDAIQGGKKKLGVDRVKNDLERKKKAPNWCPLQLNE